MSVFLDCQKENIERAFLGILPSMFSLGISKENIEGKIPKNARRIHCKSKRCSNSFLLTVFSKKKKNI